MAGAPGAAASVRLLEDRTIQSLALELLTGRELRDAWHCGDVTRDPGALRDLPAALHRRVALTKQALAG